MAETPMMKQYRAIKKEHPDCFLFFRMGDFYEMFGDDAVRAAKVLNITLTTRDKGSKNAMPMCGVPHHALKTYLPRMIRAGHKVAICEQMEDPKTVKGLVKRQVIQVVTPGAVMDATMLDEKSHNFLVAIAPGKRGMGLAAADLSTGLLRVCEFLGDAAVMDMAAELQQLDPKQVIVPEGYEEKYAPLARALEGDYAPLIDRLEPWIFGDGAARETLYEQFSVRSLDGFGLEGMDAAISAAGAATHYLRDTQKGAVQQLRQIRLHNPTDYMRLDPATLRNLELTKSLIDGSRTGSLLGLIDETVSPMGARALKELIVAPLVDVEKIDERLRTVAAFHNAPECTENIRAWLSGVGDLERVAGRVAQPSCSPRDLLALWEGLARLPELRKGIASIDSPVAIEWKAVWDNVEELTALITEAISDHPPTLAREGGAIREGYSPGLDELRSIKADSRQAILNLEEEERSQSGIAKLRIKFNKVYGYFYEVSKLQSTQVPEEWIRKQSLVNSERFASPRLKELEEKILHAEEEAVTMELALYREVHQKVAAEIARAQLMAAVVGSIDLFCSLAALARKRNYNQPEVNNEGIIAIKEGRHPIIEATDLAERFVPNDALLNCEESRLSILTGPNMAGKSTYIRQVALITLMAQIGSFVPAKSAVIGVCDRIFTRVGAQDHLQKGQSTFMVEMNETAMILNNSSAKSLIVLDEIGRGTSTFDGISIAWAVAEYIHQIGARTLFATHYHELTELADSLDGVRNFSVAVKEWNDEIIFLRRIIEGGADKSYGIQVARLAGLPQEVISRAGEILSFLEANELDNSGHPKLKAKSTIAEGAAPGGKTNATSSVGDYQISMFAPQESAIERELRELDTDSLTPLQALQKLAEWKKRV